MNKLMNNLRGGVNEGLDNKAVPVPHAHPIVIRAMKHLSTRFNTLIGEERAYWHLDKDGNDIFTVKANDGEFTFNVVPGAYPLGAFLIWIRSLFFKYKAYLDKRGEKPLRYYDAGLIRQCVNSFNILTGLKLEFDGKEISQGEDSVLNLNPVNDEGKVEPVNDLEGLCVLPMWLGSAYDGLRYLHPQLHGESEIIRYKEKHNELAYQNRVPEMRVSQETNESLNEAKTAEAPVPPAHPRILRLLRHIAGDVNRMIPEPICKYWQTPSGVDVFTVTAIDTKYETETGKQIAFAGTNQLSRAVNILPALDPLSSVYMLAKSCMDLYMRLKDMMSLDGEFPCDMKLLQEVLDCLKIFGGFENLFIKHFEGLHTETKDYPAGTYVVCTIKSGDFPLVRLEEGNGTLRAIVKTFAALDRWKVNGYECWQNMLKYVQRHMEYCHQYPASLPGIYVDPYQFQKNAWEELGKVNTNVKILEGLEPQDGIQSVHPVYMRMLKHLMVRINDTGGTCIHWCMDNGLDVFSLTHTKKNMSIDKSNDYEITHIIPACGPVACAVKMAEAAERYNNMNPTSNDPIQMGEPSDTVDVGFLLEFFKCLKLTTGIDIIKDAKTHDDIIKNISGYFNERFDFWYEHDDVGIIWLVYKQYTLAKKLQSIYHLENDTKIFLDGLMRDYYNQIAKIGKISKYRNIYGIPDTVNRWEKYTGISLR